MARRPEGNAPKKKNKIKQKKEISLVLGSCCFWLAPAFGLFLFFFVFLTKPLFHRAVGFLMKLTGLSTHGVVTSLKLVALVSVSAPRYYIKINASTSESLKKKQLHVIGCALVRGLVSTHASFNFHHCKYTRCRSPSPIFFFFS